MHRFPPAILGFTALFSACAQDVVVRSNEEVETFTPGTDRDPADLLFVVDDSSSMLEEQARLAENLASLVDVIVEAGADARLGVVTTDVEAAEAGRFRGGVFDTTDGDVLEGLRVAVQVGTDGSRDEQGLEAVLLALDGRNDGFPREGARTEIVVFSDEDDQSTDAAGDYYDALWAQLAPDVRVHGVVGDLPDGCFSADGAADPTPRYHELIELTDGYQESICAPSYDTLLERLGLDVAGVLDTYPLGHLPVVDTIIVLVDEVEVAADSEQGWTYEPAPNAVVFHGESVPVAGQEVEIAYTRLAGGASF